MIFGCAWMAWPRDTGGDETRGLAFSISVAYLQQLRHTLITKVLIADFSLIVVRHFCSKLSPSIRGFPKVGIPLATPKTNRPIVVGNDVTESHLSRGSLRDDHVQRALEHLLR